MRVTLLSALMICFFFFECQKARQVLEPAPIDTVQEPETDENKDSVVVVKPEEPASDILYADTSKVALAPGFEKLLILRGIDPDKTVDGFVLYKHIKDIDSLVIYDYLDAENDTLKGIEAFTSLRYFYTVSLNVKTLDLNRNKKLETFTHSRWAHCMGCGKLKTLIFGTDSNLKSLTLVSPEELSKVDFKNLKHLKDLTIHSATKLKSINLSACAEIERVNCVYPVTLGVHPRMTEFFGTTTGYGLTLANLPNLEHLNFISNGRSIIQTNSKIDFSANNKLKSLTLSSLHLEEVTLSGCKDLESLTIYGYGDWTQTNLDLRNSRNLKTCALFGTRLATICVPSLTDMDFSGWEKNEGSELVVCK